MNPLMKRSKMMATIFLLWGFSACTPGMYQNLFSSGGLQVTPSSTTVGVNQNMAFQVNGGTAPYQYQVSGVGSIDNNGNYQSGMNTGQAQIQVTDANNTTGSAAVSVVQSASSSNPYSNQGQSYKMTRVEDATGTTGASQQGLRGWAPTTSSDLKQAPLVLGRVVAAEDRRIDPGGDAIQSKFIETNLKHPLVRLDSLLEDERIVAARAVIEDQFVVTLQQGYSEADLSAVVVKAGAHISKQMASRDTYLVSMDKSAGPSELALSSDFFSKRTRLKEALQVIGQVGPNYISRAPSASRSAQ